MKQKHSPLPWTAWVRPLYTQDDGAYCGDQYLIASGNYQVADFGSSGDRHTSRENVEFTYTAVNSHYANLAKIERLEKRVAELEDALRPFAKFALAHPSDEPEVIYAFHGKETAELKLEDALQAHRILAKIDAEATQSQQVQG